MRRLDRVSLIPLASLLAAAPAFAQLGFLKPAPTPPAPAAPAESEEAAPDSPRASLSRFLDLARRSDFAGAAKFLELSNEDRVRGDEIAKRLKAVLDQHLWIDLAKVSARPDGDEADGLAGDVEEIGHVAATGGALEPVRLVKRRAGAETIWQFSRRTLQRVDGWYAALPHRWILDRLPDDLRRSGPRDVARWQWVGLLGLVPVCAILGFLLGRLSGRLLRRLSSRTASRWDDEVALRLGGPLALAWGLALFAVAVPYLELYAPGRQLVGQILKAGVALAIFWAVLRLVDVLREGLLVSPWAANRRALRSFLPMGSRITKLFVGALGVVSALAALGYPVASLLAGLGIGGIVLALAAQKTVENLFGAFSIGVDQPFREGDAVRFEGVEGTVEQIGLRSTRIRTLDRTLVSLPNGKLADSRIESVAARDRIRFHATLGLSYDAKPGQIRAIVAAVRALLNDHPGISRLDPVQVHFRELTDSSLNVVVNAWFATGDWAEFLEIRQEMLLRILEAVAAEGLTLAFPSRTIYLAGPAPNSPVV